MTICMMPLLELSKLFYMIQILISKLMCVPLYSTMHDLKYISFQFNFFNKMICTQQLFGVIMIYLDRSLSTNKRLKSVHIFFFSSNCGLDRKSNSQLFWFKSNKAFNHLKLAIYPLHYWMQILLMSPSKNSY